MLHTKNRFSGLVDLQSIVSFVKLFILCGSPPRHFDMHGVNQNMVILSYLCTNPSVRERKSVGNKSTGD